MDEQGDAAMQYRNNWAGDAEAGRKTMEACVQVLHDVERPYEDAQGKPAHGTSRDEHHHEKRVGEPVEDRYDSDAGKDTARAGGGISFL